MTDKSKRPFWKAKTRRTRAGNHIGLVNMRVWAEPQDIPVIEAIMARTEPMITAEVERRHGVGSCASLEEIRAMADSGQIKAPDNAGPGEDLPDGFWDDAKPVQPE